MMEIQTRRTVELVLRVVALAAFATAVGISWCASTSTPTAPAVVISRAVLSDTTGLTTIGELTRQLARETNATTTSWPRAYASIGSIPARAPRRAISVAIAAGVPFTWYDSTNASGLALSAEAILDPNGGVLLRSSVGSSPTVRPARALALRDAAGVLDSGMTDALALRAMRIAGRPFASSGASQANIDPPTLPTLRHVLLLARVGWEAKFVVAALEERGWTIDGSLQLSPKTSVTIGTPSTLDTSRFAAVVVLDSGVTRVAALARFIKQGGGLVIAGDALRDAALTSILPANVNQQRSAVPGALLTDVPRDGLALWRLTPRARAVVLQYDGSGARRTPAVVVQRRGAGRVVASGYRDTWRWRMEGNDDGIDAHRAWWSALISDVAFAPTAKRDKFAAAWPGDAAPYADLVARWGTPVTSPFVASSSEHTRSRRWLLYVLAVCALLGEWTSRRLRGAP